MKAQNLIIVALAGLGAWYFLSRNKQPVKPVPWTPGMASQFPGIAQQPAIGAPTCPPGFYLSGGMCLPQQPAQTGQQAPTVLKASEDLVWVDGQLVPVSQVFG